jgi:hypothetical protein
MLLLPEDLIQDTSQKERLVKEFSLKTASGGPIAYEDAISLVSLRQFRLESMAGNPADTLGMSPARETDYVFFENNNGLFLNLINLLGSRARFIVCFGLTKHKSKGNLTPDEFKKLVEINSLVQRNLKEEAKKDLADFQTNVGLLVETVILTATDKTGDIKNILAGSRFELFDFGGHCCNS